MSNIASINLVFAAPGSNLNLKNIWTNQDLFLLNIPEISLQNDDVLQLNVFHHVPVVQSVKVSMKRQNNGQQGHHPVVKLENVFTNCSIKF